MTIIFLILGAAVLAALWSTVRHSDDAWTEGDYHADQVRACTAQRNHPL